MKKYVVEGEGLSKKVNENEQENRQIKPISTFILWKILPDFSNSKKFFLISCLAVANKKLCCFEPSSAYKVVFFLKKGAYIFSFVFLWTCKYLYCHCCKYNCKKHWKLIFYIEKFFFFFLLSFPDFSFENSWTWQNFLWEGGNLLRQVYVDGGSCKTNRVKQGVRELKIWKFCSNVLFECPLS